MNLSKLKPTYEEVLSILRSIPPKDLRFLGFNQDEKLEELEKSIFPTPRHQTPVSPKSRLELFANSSKKENFCLQKLCGRGFSGQVAEKSEKDLSSCELPHQWLSGLKEREKKEEKVKLKTGDDSRLVSAEIISREMSKDEYSVTSKIEKLLNTEECDEFLDVDFSDSVDLNSCTLMELCHPFFNKTNFYNTYRYSVKLIQFANVKTLMIERTKAPSRQEECGYNLMLIYLEDVSNDLLTFSSSSSGENGSKKDEKKKTILAGDAIWISTNFPESFIKV
jgi:hypothetical protein